MPTTNFPFSAKRGDPEGGYMVVQQMVYWLRDVVDKISGSIVRGSATIISTATTVTCTLPSSLAVYSVVATPLLNPGGNWWISGKTSTQFTINLAVAAPVGGIPFDWIVKGA